jgi:hypothetical protein
VSTSSVTVPTAHTGAKSVLVRLSSLISPYNLTDASTVAGFAHLAGADFMSRSAFLPDMVAISTSLPFSPFFPRTRADVRVV